MLMTKHVTTIAKHIKAEEKMCGGEFRLLCTDTVHYYLIITVMAAWERKKTNKKKVAACGATTGWGPRDGNRGQNRADFGPS